MSQLMKDNIPALLGDIQLIIEQAKANIALSVNSEITRVYWKVGHRIRVELLKERRAEYGKKLIKLLADDLTQRFGHGWSEKQLRHCLRMVETFPDESILSTLWRQLSWSHFKELTI